MWIDSLAVDSRQLEDVDEYSTYMGPMAEYPRLAYSMNAVRRAGERLAGDILLYPESTKEDGERVLETFAIANSWRDSHIYPMRSVRFSTHHHIRKMSLKGDMASRPKRMASIRRKLKETTTKLDQMNDLGGCRAIMDDIASVNRLIASIGERFPHECRQGYPYIERPKPDGYRSHHLVFTFVPTNRDSEAFGGRRIELQVRTRLQHAWATAVEAVSLYRGQDLKHGKGDADWLRMFALASAEFAYVENCPVNEAMPCHRDRVRELRSLNEKIGAVNVLENIGKVTYYAENFIHDRGRYYLIHYRKDRTVMVESYDRVIVAADELGHQESLIEIGEADEKVVLVEVDKVDKLVQTYPNYFGDVSLFVSNLRKICDGKEAVEYSMAPQQVVKPKPPEKGDPSLLRRRYTTWIDRFRR